MNDRKRQQDRAYQMMMRSKKVRTFITGDVLLIINKTLEDAVIAYDKLCKSAVECSNIIADWCSNFVRVTIPKRR